ncbi:hypothetical protein Ancab_004208 [Ancistrocladus abbreviatus]
MPIYIQPLWLSTASKARPLHYIPVPKNDALLQQAREILKARMERKDVIGSYSSGRVSPGGPDPLHH